MANPAVTVLMPVYNGEKYLREAIESILAQTFTDFEFLIINDGSTDGTREIARSYRDPRIRLVDNPMNMGLVKSLNRGLELASGELIARQDSDDVSYPTRLERQITFLDAHPEVVLVGTQAHLANQHGSILHTSAHPLPYIGVCWQLLFDNPFVHTSVMFRRAIGWNKLQGYNETFILCEDFELWSRMARAYEVRNLPDILVKYRIHPHSVMRKNSPPRNGVVEYIYFDNLQVFLHTSCVSAEWARLMSMLRLLPLVAAEVQRPERLIVAIDVMFRRFCMLHPTALIERDIRRYQALQFWRVAYCLTRYNRPVSLSAWMRACQADPRIIWSGWGAKYIARFFGGEMLRTAYRKHISHRQYAHGDTV